jgi:calcineurin-like phosphoesterase family protein
VSSVSRVQGLRTSGAAGPHSGRDPRMKQTDEEAIAEALQDVYTPTRRFFTSDLHFGHNNIIAFCQRPFDSVDEMNECLINNWNSVVTDDDEVWVLGDVCMGKLDDSLNLINELNGTLHLISGNHDRTWSGNKKGVEAAVTRYLAAGFTTISESGSGRVGGRHVLMSHFPYERDERHGARFADFHPIDQGAWLLHGHVHELWRQRGRQINVGTDAWNYTPVSEETIIDLIAGGSQHIDRYGTVLDRPEEAP